MKISVSFLKSPYSKKETIQKIAKTTADSLHVDLTDGKFTPQKNFEIKEMQALLNQYPKPLDFHFMTEEVEPYFDVFLSLNPYRITFHVELKEDISRLIQKVKAKNIKVGLAIKLETPMETLIPYFEQIDTILVLSVKAGMGGQKFDDETISRLKWLRTYQKMYHFEIMVDGGINNVTIEKVKPLVDIAVSGSFVCESEDYEKQIERLKSE